MTKKSMGCMQSEATQLRRVSSWQQRLSLPSLDGPDDGTEVGGGGGGAHAHATAPGLSPDRTSSMVAACSCPRSSVLRVRQRRS